MIVFHGSDVVFHGSDMGLPAESKPVHEDGGIEERPIGNRDMAFETQRLRGAEWPARVRHCLLRVTVPEVTAGFSKELLHKDKSQPQTFPHT